MPQPLQSIASIPLTKLAVYRQARHLKQAVSEVSGLINQHSQPGQPRIFIDGGSNNGTTLRAFIDALPKDFKFYGFEVQEDLMPKLQSVQADYPDREIEVRHAGLSDHNGQIEYFPSKTLPWGGIYDRISTTTEHGRNLETHLDYRTTATAPAINFSDFLADVFVRHTTHSCEPFIAVKLNIEGAEYPVLARVIEDGRIDQIGCLTAEFHYSEFNGKPDGGRFKGRHDQIMACLDERRIPVHDWTLRGLIQH